MAIALATYAINGIRRRPQLSGRGAKSQKFVEVTITCVAGDTYVTGGVTPVAASCKLTSIAGYQIRGVYGSATTSYHARQSGWTTPKIMLFVADDADLADELADTTSLTDVVFVLVVEGY